MLSQTQRREETPDPSSVPVSLIREETGHNQVIIILLTLMTTPWVVITHTHWVFLQLRTVLASAKAPQACHRKRTTINLTDIIQRDGWGPWQQLASLLHHLVERWSSELPMSPCLFTATQSDLSKIFHSSSTPSRFSSHRFSLSVSLPGCD